MIKKPFYLNTTYIVWVGLYLFTESYRTKYHYHLTFLTIQLLQENVGNLVVGLGVCDGRPGHRVDLFFLVSHPLTSDVIFAVIPRQVVVKQGYRRVGVVLDPLQGGPEVGHEVRRSDVRRRRKTLEEEIVALLQPDVDGAHRLVGERSDSEFFARTIVNLEHLKIVKHYQLKNLLRLFEYPWSSG